MTITTEDTRTVKALAALERTGQWLKVRDAAGRAVAYGIPSASTIGQYHLATARECTCPDHARFGHHCWHSRAVAMHVAATRGQPKTRPVLTMRRHPDGEISWERHDHADGNVVYMPRH
jgi:hypothetical protein